MTTEEKKNSIIPLIIGIAIGGFIVYLLLRNKQSTQQLQQLQQPIIDISPIEKRLTILEQSTRQMQQQIQHPMLYTSEPSVPLATEHLNIQNSEQSQKVPESEASVNQLLTTYKNNELWNINRKTDGSIDSIEVKRDVKKSEN